LFGTGSIVFSASMITAFVVEGDRERAMTPRLSVVIRSFNRLPALVGMLEQLLAQRHDAFEVIVVDQSTERPADAVAKLAELAHDPRLRVMQFPPLGGARARNIGVGAARGEVIVLLDDDDTPVGDDWLTQMEAPFADPACLGITCRQLWREDDRPSATYRALARRRCMRLSPLLQTPSVYARYDEPLRPVHHVHGTGGAIRRTAFERFGGWDTDTPIEDELSFALRVLAGKRPDEYFAFVPAPTLRRHLDLGGGLGKRALTAGGFYKKFMTFVHHILGRYRPLRVRLLYPLYVLAGLTFVLDWIWNDALRYQTFASRLGASALFVLSLPVHAMRMLGDPFGKPDGAAVPGSDQLRAA
jgi:glycosyltransferase involved in cell wall biosynthesis